MARDPVGLTCARTISYESAGFVSLNRDIFRAIRYSHIILAAHRLRLLCERDFDDEKTSSFIVGLDEEFVFRLCHNRTLLVSKKRREVLLEDSVPTIRLSTRFHTYLKLGGRWRKCQVNLGYRKVHLPGHKKPYWLVISEVPALRQMWILLSNVPIERPSKPRRSGLTSAAVGELSRSSALSRKKAYTSRTSGSCPWKASVAWQTSSSWLPSSSSMGATSSRQGLAHLAALGRQYGVEQRKGRPVSFAARLVQDLCLPCHTRFAKAGRPPRRPLRTPRYPLITYG